MQDKNEPPYSSAYPQYRQRGWLGTLPIPQGRKDFPPKGFTGWDGVDPSGPDCYAWAEDDPSANIALRMPEGIVGLDGDGYGGRTGLATLAEGARRWGPLPPSPMSTSREDGSGIRFYRVPAGTILRTGITFSELGIGHVEIIQRHHRYAVVASSIHPEGRPYGWYGPDGAPLDVPPSVDELPELPAAWREALAGTGYRCEPACPEQVASFLAELPDGAPCRAVGRALNTAVMVLVDPVESRHDDTRDHVLRLLRLGEKGHPGVADALEHLRAEFVARVSADGSRTPTGAGAEFDRMAQGERGVGLILSTPTDPLDRRCDCPGIDGQNGQNPDVGRDAGGSGDSVHGSGAPWNDTPSDLGRHPAPLPVDAMGPVLGPLVAGIARSYQVPTDLVANLALPIITTAAQGRWTVRVSADWTETLAVATASALGSGERKSPTYNTLRAPLRDYERRLQAEARGAVARAEAEHRLMLDRAENLRKDALKKKDPGGTSDLAYLAAEQRAAEHDIPVLPQLLCDDVTPERLAVILSEQRGAVGLISSEPGLFAIVAGRYSNGAPNVEKVLQGTSGDPFQVDRQGREPVIVDHPALSIGVCIQPGLLAELGRGTFRRSGLLARFAYVVPAALVGTRTESTEPLSENVSRLWADHLVALATEARRRDERAELKLTPDALGVLNTFRARLEPSLHPHHGRLAELADWGSKLPGLVVRIAAALTLLTDPHATEITAGTMTDAVCLGEGYTAHALAAFGLIHGRDDALHRAREVCGWLVHHGQSEITLREVHRALRGRAWVTSANDVRAVLTVLADYGHVRRLDEEREAGQPGRPSERFQLHPDVLNETDR